MNLDSLRYLQTSLARIDNLIRAAVQRAQSAEHNPADALRGLIISEDEIENLLDRPPLVSLWNDDGADNAFLPPIETGDDVLFQHLVRLFDLSLLDSYILLLCLAPELDRRYERLFAFLHDDVSQRRPTVNLLMNVLATDLTGRFTVWERLSLENPLRRFHLVECVPDSNRSDAPFLAHYVRADHRIVAYLLGETQPDTRLKHAVKIETDADILPVPNPLPAPSDDNIMFYLRGNDHTARRETVMQWCVAAGMPLVTADLALLRELEIDFNLAWRLALREAYLADAVLLLEKWDAALEDHSSQPVPALWNAILDYPRPVFLAGKSDWEARDMFRTRRILRVQFDTPAYPERLDTWTKVLQFYEINVNGSVAQELAQKFRFTQRQIARAISTAADMAASNGRETGYADLLAGAQAHASLRLGQLAGRIIPRYEWNDLILPPDPLKQLGEIVDRSLYAHRVMQEWGFNKKVAPVARVSALFAGDSGTGKTMAAEVIAHMLGLVLYRVDLSAVVSKYIGETEKNLSAIFEEARSSNAILFFDEADALFGKRSEVKDARDRYANVEIAYLLQQIEGYDGIAILATNLRQNLDEAFTRRLDFMIDFPFPEPEYRERIWQVHFPPPAPLGNDVSFTEIAHQYRLAGGNIRNAALASAYLAAADGNVITMQHIRHAVRREHQKMGRLLD